MTEEYAVQQAVNGSVEDPGHRIEYCVQAIDEQFPDRRSGEYADVGDIGIATDAENGYLEVAHMLPSESDREALKETISLTGCEVVATEAAYRDDLRAVERVYCVAPREWVRDLDVDFEAVRSNFRDGSHLDPPERKSTVAARVDLSWFAFDFLDTLWFVAIAFVLVWGLFVELADLFPVLVPYLRWALLAGMAVAGVLVYQTVSNGLYPAFEQYRRSKRRERNDA